MMNKVFETALWIQGQPVDYGENDALYYKDHHNIILHKEWYLDSLDKETTLTIASLGYYVLSINGQRVGNDELNSDWTDFTKCVYYETYEVASYLHKGMNIIEIELGNGMYNPSPLRLFGKYNLRERLSEVGDPRMICEMKTHDHVMVQSDHSWTYRYGSYLFNNLYLGEKVDLDYQDNTCHPVVILTKNYHLEKSMIPKITRHSHVAPVVIKEYKEGLFIDFGEMISGYIDLRVNAHKGQSIKLQYCESCHDGELDFTTSMAGSVGEQINDFVVPGGLGAPLYAIQNDEVLTKEGLNHFRNQFTYHSFRYVYLTGCKKEDIAELQAIYVHTNLKSVGAVQTDHLELNALYEAGLRTKLNNVHSVFEDCARERLGYGGDIVALAMSNLYLFDLEGMYHKVIKDFRYEQTDNGGIPETAPYMGIQSNGTGQGEGPLLWQLVYPYLVNKHYQFYGDKEILKQELPYLQKQMDYLLSLDLTEGVQKCLGDHGSILIAGQFRKPTPDKLFLGYCTYLLMLQNNIHILHALDQDASSYQQRYEEIRAITIKTFRNEDGSFGEGTQSGYAFAAYLKLGDENLVEAFCQKIEADHYILNSGIFGMALTYEVLSCYGYNNVIEKWLLNQQDHTFYRMLSNGNKALAELFTGEHMSMNHAMFSSYMQWYYQGLGGLHVDQEAIACNKMVLKPYFAKAINKFSCHFETKQGLVTSSWHRSNGAIHWSYQMPEGIAYTLNLDGYQVVSKEQKGALCEMVIYE